MTTALGLSHDEVKLFEEVQKVMDKFPHLDRSFGLSLVHSHFDMSSSEILHEVHDKENRTMTITPVQRSNVKGSMATQWNFDEKGKVQVAQYCCDYDESTK